MYAPHSLLNPRESRGVCATFSLTLRYTQEVGRHVHHGGIPRVVWACTLWREVYPGWYEGIYTREEVYPGWYMPGIHLGRYTQGGICPTTLGGVYPGVYIPYYTTLGTPAVCPLHWLHVEQQQQCGTTSLWAQKRRNPWVEASLSLSGPKSVREVRSLCAELLRFPERLLDKDWIDEG